RLLVDTGAVPERRRFDEVGEPPPPAARADREHDRRPVSCTDDHVRRPAGTVEEVPRFERPLLALDEEQALARQHQEPFLVVLAVIQPERLAGLEDVQVDAELLERSLSLEIAAGSERPVVAPATLAGVEHEPAVF